VLEGIGAALYISAAIQMSGRDQWLRRFGVVVVGIIPIVLETSFVLFGIQFNIDPGPIGVGAILLILYGAIFSGGLLHTLPSAQLDLVHHLPVPMLIASRNGFVIDSNPAARALLGLTLQRTLWRDVDEVLSEIDDPIEAERWPIVSNGQEAAQLVLLDSPTKPEQCQGGERTQPRANTEEAAGE
jgi:PAS domain-containing protein